MDGEGNTNGEDGDGKLVDGDGRSVDDDGGLVDGDMSCRASHASGRTPWC